eukprot:3438058-Pleurochrysis_carterae.AAC.2
MIWPANLHNGTRGVGLWRLSCSSLTYCAKRLGFCGSAGCSGAAAWLSARAAALARTAASSARSSAMVATASSRSCCACRASSCASCSAAAGPFAAYDETRGEYEGIAASFV